MGLDGSYFGWQSLAFNPTMRYQLPIYPLLCMLAAWFVFELASSNTPFLRRFNLRIILASLVGITILVLTFAWAYAFTRIYTRLVTRVAATYWIYQNVPGPINLHIHTADGSVYQEPLPFPTGGLIQNGVPYPETFKANASGSITDLYFPHIGAVSFTTPQTFSLSLGLQPDLTAGQPIGKASLASDFATGV